MGGNPAAGLLVLLVALYLLLAFFGGRLDWLFSLGAQVGAARAASPAAGSAPVSPAVSPTRPTTSGDPGATWA